MKPKYSKIIVEDMVLPDANCSAILATADIMMLAACGGKERTRTEWEDLLRTAGLRIVRVTTEDVSAESVIEAELA